MATRGSTLGDERRPAVPTRTPPRPTNNATTAADDIGATTHNRPGRVPRAVIRHHSAAPADDDSVAQPWMFTAAEVLATAARHHDEPAEQLIATGNAAIDAATGGGLAPGTLTVLIGPSGPCTAAAIAAAYHAAHHRHVTTFLYPLRSTPTQIAAHLAHIHAGIDTATLGSGHSPQSAGEIADTAYHLATSPLFITIGTPITADYVRNDALDRDIAPQLIVIDGTSLLHTTTPSRHLKHIALELNIAVLCSTTTHATTNPAPTPAEAPADLAAADTIITIPTQTTRIPQTPPTTSSSPAAGIERPDRRP